MTCAGVANLAMRPDVHPCVCASKVYGILADGGFSLTVDTAADLLSWAMDGEAKDNFDKGVGSVEFVANNVCLQKASVFPTWDHCLFGQSGLCIVSDQTGACDSPELHVLGPPF